MRDKPGLLSRFVQAVALRTDSWVNEVTGLGTSRDKRIWSHAELEPLPPEELEVLYRASAVHARVVDMLPDECFRSGFEIRIPGEAETAQETNALLADLQAEHHLAAAYRSARHYGGGLVRITVRDGRHPGEPLDMENIQRVVALNHFSSREAWAYEYYGDMDRENFGQVARYFLAPLFVTGMTSSADNMLDATRALRLEGVIGERHVNQGNFGWPDSVLQRVHETIRDWSSGYASAAHLLHDASQGVYKLPELTKLLMQNRMDVVSAKIAAIDQAKSVLRGILLGEGETYERQDTTFTGIADTLTRMDFQLAAVTGTPVTVLLGQAPAGLNATGSADLELFRAVAQAERRKRIQPQAEKLVRIVFRSKRGPTGGKEPAKWSITWRPLSVPTDKELADTRKTHAETAQILVDMGAVTARDVARSMFGGEEYSADLNVDPAVLEDLPEPEELDPLDELPPGAPEVGGPPALTPSQPASASALNGAQMTSAKSIVSDVAAKLLPRESGIGMLMEFCTLTRNQAENIMGEVGRTFFAAPPGTAPAAEPVPAPELEPAPTPDSSEHGGRADDAGEHAALLLRELKEGLRTEDDVTRRVSKLFSISRREARALVRSMAKASRRSGLKPTRGDKTATHFPKRGDNHPVAMKHSRWQSFDVAYARELREKWPEIWARGGNTLGNRQFQRLAPLAERGGAPEAPSEDKAVRLREAWAARHEGDKRLSGIIAQVKWLVVGNLGEQGMKDAIEEEKTRLRQQRGEG